jgi:hypothetical protein
MTRTVAPYGLDDPSEYDHYDSFTAMLAGNLVERNDGLDILLDVLARHCESEYGLSDADRKALGRALTEDTQLLDHIERTLTGHEQWVLDNTFSNIDERADMALYSDVVTELRDFVAQRYCEEAGV